MPGAEQMQSEDFSDVKDAVELERLIALEAREQRAEGDTPDPVHAEVLAALRARLEELRAGDGPN